MWYERAVGDAGLQRLQERNTGNSDVRVLILALSRSNNTIHHTVCSKAPAQHSSSCNRFALFHSVQCDVC